MPLTEVIDGNREVNHQIAITKVTTTSGNYAIITPGIDTARVIETER